MKNCPTCSNTYPTNFAVCPQDGTTLVEVGAWADGSVVRGKFRIVSKVGQGGMGAVYKALHLDFDELRALKVISTELMADELFVKRFKNEAKITRKLHHPNAVRVDDIDEAEDGRPFIVMEFIEGQSLKKLIQDQGPQPAPRVCTIIRQVAAALEAAHKLGMIHRDIKPENIALIDTSEGEQAKVLDFGIAKVKEARLGGGVSSMTMTGTGVVIGTPQYMSPEQAMGKRGDELDGRSDLYSLGIVMYQMLSGDLPFKAETTMGMLLAHLQQAPATFRELHPELQIPDSVTRLVMRLLEKDPNRRPASAKELMDDIDRAVAGIAPLGETRVVRPTEAAPRESERPVQRTTTPKREAAEVVSPPVLEKPAVEFEVPKVSRVEREAPPVQPKPSPWRLLAGVAVLAIIIGGGGWYFLGRNSRTTQGPDTGTTVQGSDRSGGSSGTSTSSGGSNQSSLQQGQQAGGAPDTSRSLTSGPPGTGQSSTTKRVPKTASHPEAPPQVVTGQTRHVVNQEIIRQAIAEGRVLHDRGLYNEEIAGYQNALKEDPNNAELLQKIEIARRARAAEERTR